MRKHRVILIGCGGMAKQHVKRFDEVLDRVEIAAAVDIERERAQAVSDLLPNHPPVFTDYHEAFPLGDAALVVLPHHLHPVCTIDCLNAGLHVLCEKPLANTEADCLAMIDAAKKNHRTLMVAYCMRFHPIIREMHRLIREEERAREKVRRGLQYGGQNAAEDAHANHQKRCPILSFLVC